MSLIRLSFVFIYLIVALYCFKAIIGLNLKVARRLIASSSLVVTLGFNPVLLQNAHGIDALDAATREMFKGSAKERVVIDRAFESLPESAKKRRGLALCKEDKARRVAGFSSQAECTSQVLAGNYAIVTKSTGVGEAESKPSSRTAATTTKSVSGSESTRPTKKVNDYSDLTTAQKKRRALAACKRPEVRQFAGAGSESKCSTDVNRGNFDKIVEALEYGV